ncbi:MAG: hypothetical protein U0694_04745 [Anaerolineae bacterium]
MLRVYTVSSMTSLALFVVLMPLICLLCTAPPDYHALRGFVEG